MNTLIERLRTDAIFDNSTLGNEAADAIEAKDAEIAEVKGFWKEAQRKNRSLLDENADLALLADQYKAERDALQAKLDAAAKQVPVASIYISATDREFDDWKYDLPAGRNELYAAPVVASQPLTDERLRQMRTDARASEECANEYWFMLFARAIERAHGIGGQP